MSAVGVSRDSIHSLAEPFISLLSVTSHVNDDISLLAAQQCNTYGNGIAELIQVQSCFMHHAAASLCPLMYAFSC